MNYYRKANAAEIWVRDAEFSVGDELIVQGPTTGSVRVTVESIQTDHTAKQKAARGERVAIGIAEPVRAKDRVFLVTERG
jgi:putative protease